MGERAYMLWVGFASGGILTFLALIILFHFLGPGAAIVNPSFVLSAQRALECGVGVPFWVMGRSDRFSPVIVVAVVCLVEITLL